MAKQLKTDRTYTTEFGNTHTGPSMYAVLTKANFDIVNSIADIVMELHESQACYEAGNSPYAKVSKRCNATDFATYFSTIESLSKTYWDNEETLIDAQYFIREDWEDIT